MALFVFLGLSILISWLYARAVERADVAEAKERELQTLQELSRDLVVRGPGAGHLRGAARRRRGAVRVRRRRPVRARRGRPGSTERVVVGAPRGRSRRRGTRPTRVARRNDCRCRSARARLGLIVLTGERPALDGAEVRVLRAVCDQLALVLERDRLLEAATDAEILRRTETARRNDARGGLARSAEPVGGDQGVGHRSARPGGRSVRRGSCGRAARWSTTRRIGSTRSSRTSSTCRGSRRACCGPASRRSNSRTP